jgi:hypothetical protein
VRSNTKLSSRLTRARRCGTTNVIILAGPLIIHTPRRCGRPENAPPAVAGAARQLAQVYRGRGDWARWQATLEALLKEEDPGLDHAAIDVDLARHFREMGQWQKARPYAEAAAQSIPTAPALPCAWRNASARRTVKSPAVVGAPVFLCFRNNLERPLEGFGRELNSSVSQNWAVGSPRVAVTSILPRGETPALESGLLSGPPTV